MCNLRSVHKFNVAGGKLVYQTTKKRASGPKCPVTGKRIQGVSFLISIRLCFVSVLELRFRLDRVGVRLFCLPQVDILPDFGGILPFHKWTFDICYMNHSIRLNFFFIT